METVGNLCGHLNVGSDIKWVEPEVEGKAEAVSLCNFNFDSVNNFSEQVLRDIESDGDCEFEEENEDNYVNGHEATKTKDGEGGIAAMKIAAYEMEPLNRSRYGNNVNLDTRLFQEPEKEDSKDMLEVEDPELNEALQAALKILEEGPKAKQSAAELYVKFIKLFENFKKPSFLEMGFNSCSFWRNAIREDNKILAFQEAAKEAYQVVLSLFQNYGMPPELQILFEALEYDQNSSRTRNQKKVSNFHDVNNFKKTIISCESLTIELGAIQDSIREALYSPEMNGILSETDLEFQLLKDYVSEISILRNRLIVMDSMIGRKVKCFVKMGGDDVNEAIKLRYSSSPVILQELLNSLSEYSSMRMIDDIGIQSLVTVIDLVKTILTVSYYYTRPMTEIGCNNGTVQFSKILNDLKILVISSTKKLSCVLQIYKEKKAEEIRKAEEMQRLEELKRLEFSHENRLHRLCSSNLKLIEEQRKYLILAEEESLKLLQVSNKTDLYRESVDKLIEYEEKAFALISKLVTRLEAQTMMSLKLRRKRNLIVKETEETIPNTVEEDGVDGGDAVEEPTVVNENGVAIYSSNNNSHLEEREDEPESRNADELFIALFTEEEDGIGKPMENQDLFDEKKLHKSLYSGVVSQLKGALTSVKEAMKEREKTAVLKKFGNIKETGNLLEEEECDDQTGSSGIGSSSGSSGSGVAVADHHGNASNGGIWLRQKSEPKFVSFEEIICFKEACSSVSDTEETGMEENPFNPGSTMNILAELKGKFKERSLMQDQEIQDETFGDD